ncbi:MAG: helix-turn-helix transcriptional regulator [Bacteroidetes bacterium]|nr:helix-turn-helix transcriptional regulator [Bacteroidota bacterium]
MENTKKFEVLVTQLNRFSRKFVVEATSPLVARAAVKEMITTQPVDARKGTFDGGELIMRVREESQAEDAPKSWFAPAVVEIDLQDNERLNVTPTEVAVQKAFGTVMRRLRERLKLSQRQFSHLVYLRQPTIGVLERGETGVRLFNFIKIAVALDKAPDDLLRIVANEYEKMNQVNQGSS